LGRWSSDFHGLDLRTNRHRGGRASVLLIRAAHRRVVFAAPYWRGLRESIGDLPIGSTELLIGLRLGLRRRAGARLEIGEVTGYDSLRTDPNDHAR
jgi:hypothetical protein